MSDRPAWRISDGSRPVPPVRFGTCPSGAAIVVRGRRVSAADLAGVSSAELARRAARDARRYARIIRYRLDAGRYRPDAGPIVTIGVRRPTAGKKAGAIKRRRPRTAGWKRARLWSRAALGAICGMAGVYMAASRWAAAG